MQFYIDGGTHCYNICLYDPSHERYIIKYRKKEPTNNELEYLALLFCLEYIQGITYNKSEGITIYSDSQLVVNQINGEWSVKDEKLCELYEKCMKKMNKDIKLVWVPRAKNLAGVYLQALKDRSRGVRRMVKDPR